MTAFNQVAGLVLLHFLWQASLVGAAAAIALWLLRRASPQARYGVACLALAAMTALPVVTATVLTAGPANDSTAAPAFLAATAAPSSVSTPSESDRALARGSAIDDLLPWFVAAWIAGVAVLAVRLFGGWWRVRGLHRQSLMAAPSSWQAVAERMARQLGLTRAIHVVDSWSIDTPLTAGWLQPVVLLPVAAIASLTPEQVAAILAHELAHVRRHDYLVNLLQTLAETVLFYHPAVWWISSRIREEREQCCDAVAVQISGDAVVYAEALTELEAHRAEPRLALAAASGSLLRRVRRILGAPTDPSPCVNSVPLLLGGVAALLVSTGGLHLMARQPDDTITDRTAVAWRMVFDYPSGELSLKGYTGRDLIRFAYDVPMARVLGGPAWLDEETLDLSAHVGEDPGADRIQEVVRDILESRLGLTTHVETRDFPAYALITVGGSGPGLEPAAPCIDVQAWLNASPVRRPSDLAAQRRCGSWRETFYRIEGVGVTMAGLADTIEARFQRGLDRLDVIDRTGLTGAFDIEMSVSPLLATAGRFNVPNVTIPGMTRLPGELSEQLGVTIEPIMYPYDVIVVGNIHRPTE